MTDTATFDEEIESVLEEITGSRSKGSQKSLNTSLERRRELRPALDKTGGILAVPQDFNEDDYDWSGPFFYRFDQDFGSLTGDYKPHKDTPRPVGEAAAKMAVDAPPIAQVGVLEGLAVEEIGKLFSGDSNAYTGEAKHYELPEWPIWADAKLMDKMSLARGDDAAAADIFLANWSDPRADVDFDPDGNLILLPGGRGGPAFYLNKPGLSKQDINANIVDFAAAYTGAGLLSAPFKRAFGKIVSTGAGTGGARVATDLAAGQVGSQQGVQGDRVFWEAVLGSGGEVGERAVTRAGKVASALLRRFTNRKTGELSPQAIQVFERWGVDTSALSPEYTKHLADQLRAGADPIQAIAYADARTLPTPVSVTRGDIRRGTKFEDFEREASEGLRGMTAQQSLAERRVLQNQQMKENIEAIQNRGAGIEREADAGGLVASRLQQLRRADSNQVLGAYNLAKTFDAKVRESELQEFFRQARNKIDQDYGTGLYPAVDKFVDDLVDLSYPVRGETFVTANNGVNLKKIELWRKKVVTRREAARDLAEKQALKDLRDGYDNFLEAQLERDLVLGDDRAIQAWKNARSLRSAMSRKFTDNKIIARISDTKTRDPLTPEEVWNLVAGAGQLGAKKGAATSLRRMKSLLGEESIEWQALKEAAFMRLLKNQPQRGSSPDLESIFDGEAFRQSVKRAFQDNNSLMRTLYTPEEINLILQASRVAERTGGYSVKTAQDRKLVGLLSQKARAVGGGLGRALTAIPVIRGATREPVGGVRMEIAKAGVPSTPIDTVNIGAALSVALGNDN